MNNITRFPNRWTSNGGRGRANDTVPEVMMGMVVERRSAAHGTVVFVDRGVVAGDVGLRRGYRRRRMRNGRHLAGGVRWRRQRRRRMRLLGL